MSAEEKQKHAELLLAMSTDVLMGGITWVTFVNNLRAISDKLWLDQHTDLMADHNQKLK